MTKDIRIRQHADGRVAISTKLDYWWVILDGDAGCWCGEGGVIGDGWSDLFVAELPSPDGHLDCIGNDDEDSHTPYWTSSSTTVTSWSEGVEINDDGLFENLDDVRETALKMLAAIRSTEQFRREWRKRYLERIKSEDTRKE
jgi:hypothetical protein